MTTTNERIHEGTSLSINRLLLWTLYMAVYFATFISLPTSPTAFVIATAVAILFLLIDGFSAPRFRTPGITGISFFACGIAYAVATGLMALTQFPPLPPTRQPSPNGNDAAADDLGFVLN